ncbi:MAG: SDR family oxidoreductase [Candidatus Sumerlaeia bacterium]
MKSVIVTGGNRGLGLEHVRQHAQAGWTVFAGTRHPESSDDLKQLRDAYSENIHIVQLDVTKEPDILAARQMVQSISGKLDRLINNAGIFAPGEDGLAKTDVDKMLNVYHVNVVGPVMMAKHFADLLEKGEQAVVVNTTSGAGVLREGSLDPGKQYSYGATKAALNMVIRRMAADLKPKGVIVIGLGPGFVLTDMTKNNAKTPPLAPEESVSGQMKTIEGLTMDDTGQFFGHEGNRCDWMAN